MYLAYIVPAFIIEPADIPKIAPRNQSSWLKYLHICTLLSYVLVDILLLEKFLI